MTQEEKKYFSELTKIRLNGADVLSQSFLSGIWEGIIEKYSDQAHFIYELLQNADDVFATYANFSLHKDCLVFKHNGTRYFNVTDPNNEKIDKANGTLGDLNSISSAAQSSKKGKDSIGKFGVGFKAVFQYTDTPHIYDPNIAFKIERYIVPHLLENDYPGRKENETVFVFPFDHKERTPNDAFEDILDKLRHLIFPVLFLKNLKYVSFDVEDNSAIGMYEKNIIQERTYGDITAQKLELIYTEGGNIASDSMWLFSRKDDCNRDYCVGIFFDENEKIKPVNMPAFCYFPTKEDTKLNFIIHAPFLLTDSREGIKAGEPYNTKLISLLSTLAADSLVCVKDIGIEEGKRYIDDDILNFLPLDNTKYSYINDRSKVSFLPFYNSLKDAIQNGLLPAKNEYVQKDNAFWSNTIDINTLIEDKQIGQLYKNEQAHWVFCSKPRHAFDAYGKTTVRLYIDSIINKAVDEKELLSQISGHFIKAQSKEWLCKFYKWLADSPKRFTVYLKTSPIFINDNGEPVAAYDKEGQKTLFLPSFTVKNCPTINKDLLLDSEVKSFLLDIVKLEEPSLQDYIYNTIIPNYENDASGNTFEYFKVFYQYYKGCLATEIGSYIDKIKNLDFLEYLDEKKETHQSVGNALYFPDKKLVDFFSAKQDVRFLNLKKYTDEYNNESSLMEFFNALGVMHSPKVYSYELPFYDILKYTDLPHENSTRGHKYIETRIDGCSELARYIAQKEDSDKSFVLWEMLVCAFNGLVNIDSDGKYQYYYRSYHYKAYTSIMAQILRNERWIVDNKGAFVSAAETSLSKLSMNYDTSSDAAQKLIQYLGFVEGSMDEPLSEEQKLAIMCKKYGLENEEDFKEFREWKKQKELRDNTSSQDETAPSEEVPNAIDSIAKDISKRARKSKPNKDINNVDSHIEVQHNKHDEEEIDRDEYIPGAIDYTSKIESEKEKQAEELKELAEMQELQDVAISTEKYTYLWFKTLLNMEILNNDVDDLSNREINISFGKIEKEDGTQKTYILKHPSKYIPQYMEDLSDIPLVVHMKDGTSKSVAIEVSSVQSYTLHVKLKDANGLNGLELSNVQDVNIKATRPVFLLQALKDKLDNLCDTNGDILADDYNLKNNLPENIEFVFGPPGTGKTTYLANQVLRPLMQQNEALKVLVLTPTNKAADVITTRIMESMGSDTSYTEWLTRFGITGDERIENNVIFRDKTYDLRSLKRSVTITTIARFSYDFFMPTGERLYLDAINWDYIVIDEASMIPIAQIIYPLFRKTPQKFIIAGDPFQIEPITTVDLWADENIYKLVELNSFTNPKTVPHDYSIIKLTTQYRSIPEIGEIFSKFSYGGILKHNRDSSSRRDLHLNGYINLDSLNVLKFPVSKYESIYRSKRLNGTTPYQAYSAIFTMEFANYLASALEEKNPGEKFNIGIIAPYKAQASLIDRLMSSLELPNSIQVQVGTIHGFQGDECDIVLVVLNTPPGISSNPKLFLNKQNVLNVAISRARDYLVVIMSDNQTENIAKLHKIKQIEDLMRHSGHFYEQVSAAIEKIMFGDEKFIENNSFATSHQTVNVYGQPEKRYEIRSEDTAVDIQVHRSQIEKNNDPENEQIVDKENGVELSQSISNSGIFVNVGDIVMHKSYGKGIIKSIDETENSYIMQIHFAAGDKPFKYPDSFSNGFLTKV